MDLWFLLTYQILTFVTKTLQATAARTAAEEPEVLEKVELLVSVWCDQISRVLTVNEQTRSEPDDAG